MSAVIGYVYIKSEPGLFTVGFYDPKGKWHSDSDHDKRDDAAARVSFLNGGTQSIDQVTELSAAAHVVMEELKTFVKDESCDHSVNICYCETFRAIARLDAALKKELVEVTVRIFVPRGAPDVERLVAEAVCRELDEAPGESTVHQWDFLGATARRAR